MYDSFYSILAKLLLAVAIALFGYGIYRTLTTDSSVLMIQDEVVKHKDVIVFDPSMMADDGSCLYLDCGGGIRSRLGWTKAVGWYAVVKLTPNRPGTAVFLVQLAGENANVSRPWLGPTDDAVKVLLDKQYLPGE